MKELFLLRGLPGSGKSTVAETITNYDDSHQWYEADELFYDDEGEYVFDATRLKEVHKWCRDITEARMKQGAPRITVSNTFTQEWEMKPYYDLAEKYGYRVYSLIVENRHEGESEHGVPDETIDKMKNRFEVKLR